MTVNSLNKVAAPRHQKGAFALMAVVLLASAAMLSVLTLVRLTVSESRTGASEARAREVAHAAEAALDYGIAWYTINEPGWALQDSGFEEASPAPAFPGIAAPNGDTYGATITFRRNPANTDYLEVLAEAEAQSDTGIRARASQMLHSNLLLTDFDMKGPPLSFDGCLDGVLGNPEINSLDGHKIQTSRQPLKANGEPCIDPGHISDVSEDDIVHGAFGGDIWDVAFSVTRADLKAQAAREASRPVAERNVIWFTAGDPRLGAGKNLNSAVFGTSVLGLAGKPIILVFEECPSIQGSMEITGIVFIDNACTTANGWGGTVINGSTYINGDATGFNANTEFNRMDTLVDPDPYTLKADWVARVPGTWRDF
jgi:hypothetical protein